MPNTNRPAATWTYQTADSTPGPSTIATGKPTDSRGLRLRQECGYGWVNMGAGWLQISVAIRKLDLAERLAISTGARS